MARRIVFSRKQGMTFQDFLGVTPAGDYVFQKVPYGQQIRQAAEWIMMQIHNA